MSSVEGAEERGRKNAEKKRRDKKLDVEYIHEHNRRTDALQVKIDQFIANLPENWPTEFKTEKIFVTSLSDENKYYPKPGEIILSRINIYGPNNNGKPASSFVRFAWGGEEDTFIIGCMKYSNLYGGRTSVQAETEPAQPLSDLEEVMDRILGAEIERHSEIRNSVGYREVRSTNDFHAKRSRRTVFLLTISYGLLIPLIFGCIYLLWSLFT